MPGGQVKFTSKGEILKIWDMKAGKTGLYVSVYDESAKNPTFDTCHVKGKGKTCDMKFKNGHKLDINVFSYTKLSDHNTRELVASWQDKA